MNDCGHSYPGIIKVEFFDSSLLPERIDILSIAGVDIDVPEERFNIDLIEPGTCEVSDLTGSKRVTLKFSSFKKINPPFRPAFIIFDANDGIYLIGSKEKPFPKILINKSWGSVPDSRAEYSYEISHVAIEAPIEIKLEDNL